MLIASIAFVCLVFIGLTVRLRLKIRAEEKVTYSPPAEPFAFGPSVSITAFEIEKLSNIAYIERLETLVRQANVEQKLPVFYEKYTETNKLCREHYLENLLMLFSRGKDRELDHFMKTYPELSVPDILMLFMLDAGFDNKSIARMLWINYETFKKRKSRLRIKCATLGVPFDFTAGNASWLQMPPIGG